MLTARHRVEDRVRGLKAGADDYLVKPFAFSELVARIEVLLRRAVGAAPSPMRSCCLWVTWKSTSRRRRCPRRTAARARPKVSNC